MSYFLHDPDEWESYAWSTPCPTCEGDLRKCNGMCLGSGGSGMRKRAPEDVARIKAERLRKEEDDILVRAEAIKAKRSLS